MIYTSSFNNILKLTLSRTVSRIALGIFIILTLVSYKNAVAGIDLQLVDKTFPLKSSNTTYRALVIGNNDYQDSHNRWRPLRTAIDGARAVAGVLKSDYGFDDVVLLENASRSTILHAVNGLTKRVGENDSVLLYYAGHGYIDVDTNKGYWVPVDAQGNDHTTFLRNSTIRDELNTIANRAKHTLLISDSCFSGSLLRGTTRGPVPAIGQDRYYQQVANKKSVQIITAGGVEFVDDNYNNSGHSPFTYFLLNELKHNNKPLITASEVSTSVEKAVSNNSSQVPETGVLQGAGDELGEFIFLKLDVTVDVKGIPKENVTVDVKVTPQEGVKVLPATEESKSTIIQEKSRAPENKLQNPIPLPTL